MNFSLRNVSLFWLVVGLLYGAYAVYFLWGVKTVPFHPDEATGLFMSADFEALFKDPLALGWDPAVIGDVPQRYRLIDAPLSRYVIGLGRTVAGLEPLPVDWDWSGSWSENAQVGAFPDESLLLIGRYSISVLVLLAPIFVFLVGRQINGDLTGVVAAVLFAFDTLVLLHGRRSMMEGALLLGMTFALWGILNADKRPTLAGLGVALAFNSKQFALGLLPVGLLAILWQPTYPPDKKRHLARNLFLYLAVFGLVTIALNPIFWRKPFQALDASWQARQEFTMRSATEVGELAPGQVLDGPVERFAVLLGQLFFLPPAFYDIGNYQAETAPAEAAYLDVPGHVLLRSLIGGGVRLVLALLGVAFLLLDIRRKGWVSMRLPVMVLVAAQSQMLVYLTAVTLPWQRYVVPIVPFVALLSAYSLSRKP